MSRLLFLLNPSMIKTFECVQYKDISDDGSLNTSDLRPNTTLDVSANGSSPMDMDLDCDSPFSPGSASGLSDLFEPPNSSPPPSSLPRLFLTNRCHIISLSFRIGLPGSRSKKKGRASDSSAWQTIIGGQSGVGEPKNKRKSSRITQAQNGMIFFGRGTFHNVIFRSFIQASADEGDR